MEDSLFWSAVILTVIALTAFELIRIIKKLISAFFDYLSLAWYTFIHEKPVRGVDEGIQIIEMAWEKHLLEDDEESYDFRPPNEGNTIPKRKLNTCVIDNPRRRVPKKPRTHLAYNEYVLSGIETYYKNHGYADEDKNEEVYESILTDEEG